MRRAPVRSDQPHPDRLASHTTTLAHEYARQGKDWEVKLRQRAKEVALMNELGLSVESAVEPTAARPARQVPDEDEDDNSTD